AAFQEGVEKISDLRPGMALEGVVSNVAHFGAFVDLGVHQDGLVHISMLSAAIVRDTRDVVKAGDIVKVKVLEVDVPRQRISLTMRMGDQPGSTGGGGRGAGGERRSRPRAEKNQSGSAAQSGATFANLFANARHLRK